MYGSENNTNNKYLDIEVEIISDGAVGYVVDTLPGNNLRVVLNNSNENINISIDEVKPTVPQKKDRVKVIN